MQINNSNGSGAALARGVMALFVVLAMGLGGIARPAEAAPFAYVANSDSGTVSVIDTATNPPSVVATVTLLIGGPVAVAVTPDGKHVYVTTSAGVSVIDTATNTVEPATIPVAGGGIAIGPDGKHAYVTTIAGVSVIDTATNMVVGTPIPVGSRPRAVAVTPDGKHVFVANVSDGTVSVIATASNMVVATVKLGVNAFGVAVTPDGKHAYVGYYTFITICPIFNMCFQVPAGYVAVIDTATNMVVASVPVGLFPDGIAVTPDGKLAYVTNNLGLAQNVSVYVIDTATNTAVATVAVGKAPEGVAVTPDGKQAYVANLGDNTVSVIDTATNTVVTTVPAGNNPTSVAIVPPPPGVPFLAFNANLVIAFGGAPNQDSFALQTRLILSSAAPGINPLTEPVTLQAGAFTTTIPPGSFKKATQGVFVFAGGINGVAVEAAIEHTGTLQYAFQAKAVRASFTGTTNPVYETLIIGGDSGATSVMAKIFH